MENKFKQFWIKKGSYQTAGKYEKFYSVVENKAFETGVHVVEVSALVAMASAQNELNKLKIQNARLILGEEDLSTANNNCQHKISSLESALESASAEILSLQDKLANRELIYQNQILQIGELGENSCQMQEKINLRESENAALLEAVKELKVQLHESCENSYGLQSIIEELHAERRELKKVLIEIENGEQDYGDGVIGNMGLDHAREIAREVLKKYINKQEA